MKKIIIKIFIAVGIIIGIILLDSIQALIFDNSPIFKIRDYYNGGTLQYKDKGFLIDTYCGVNGKKDTVIKGFSYSLSYDGDFKIIVTTDDIINFNYGDALEILYEDDSYRYYLVGMKSEYIEVQFGNGKKYNIIPALQNGYINIGDLDKFDIHYIKQEKNDGQETQIVDTINTSFTTYYKMSDGTWQWSDNSYKYRLEITGRMPYAIKDTTYVYLSNSEDMTFQEAYLASGLSSSTADYFSIEDAVLVELFNVE